MIAKTTALEVDGLCRDYRIHRGMLRAPLTLHALADMTFSLAPASTLAIVGESGCGKSTLARQVALVEQPTGGSIRIGGELVDASDRAAVRRARSRVQLVFQDPYGSLNPRKQIGTILEEPLRIHARLDATARRAQVEDMMARVGLRPEYRTRYPHMFSGGQRQRVAIARALMLRPDVVVADEPVSALDVSVRAQVLNLLMDLQESFHVAYLFISHDLSVVRHIADHVLVMYLGRCVERGPAALLLGHAAHPYTRALIAATPRIEHAARQIRAPLQGEIPSPLHPPAGCAFHTRCPYAISRCGAERPALRHVEGRDVACHRAEHVLEQPILQM